jgi:XTP/dITP diphosphohydrolase
MAGKGGGEAIKILLITSNIHKAKEIRDILHNLRPDAFSIEIEPGAKKLEIRSESLEEIAYTSLKSIIESLDTSKWHSIWVEDSGLFMEALEGFPGPYSSYVLKKIGLKGILKLLEGISNKRACYRAALAYTLGRSIGVERGELCGSIAHSPDGSEGFGYDPIFMPEGYGGTLARLGYTVKNMISHRARAVREVTAKILNFYRSL